MLTLFDRIWDRIFPNAEKDTQEFMKSRRVAMGQPEDSTENGPLYDMAIIDSKSSSLLTHVSVMLVVLTFLQKDSTDWFQWFLRIELVLYAILACLTLRCVDIAGPPFRWPVKGVEEWSLEACRRRSIYQFILRCVWWLTIFLIIALVAEAFYN